MATANETDIERRAEEMLLDWMADAELGEFGYIVLTHMSRARERLRNVGSGNVDVAVAEAEIMQAKQYQSRFLLWMDDVCKRKGRPTLDDEDRAELETYAKS